jgi:nucleotide-binding universal stress UspA family protein
MKTILAPIDFSPISRRVVAEALELAEKLEGRVVLFHAVPPSPIVATDLAPLVGSALYFSDEAEKAALRHLHRQQHDLKKRRIMVDVACTSGHPATCVLQEAKKTNARYIVIGSHGHTAFYDLVTGSTASGVLKRAPCPVVVVPPLPKGKTRRTKRR